MRIFPHTHVTHHSPNVSERTQPIDGIVLHATQGANIPGDADLRGLGNWFDNPNTDERVSCHVATDGDGNSGRYVSDSLKAWHVASFNSAKLGIEQIGFAEQKTWPKAQLKETARWIARWSRLHNIPIVHSTGRGVCRHMDLGIAGGGHHDPGTSYPLTRVLRMAKRYKALQIIFKRKEKH